MSLYIVKIERHDEILLYIGSEMRHPIYRTQTQTLVPYQDLRIEFSVSLSLVSRVPDLS